MSINIYTEETPNPSTMKFVANKLLINGFKDFPNVESAKNAPFALDLFKFSFVKGVFFSSNFITITKIDGIEWADIVDILSEFIKAAIESELNIGENSTENPEFEGTDIERQIQQILHDYVRPAIEQDGGAIEFRGYSEGVVTVVLKGSCSGCPSSSMTLKGGIANLLKRMVPEVYDVIAESE